MDFRRLNNADLPLLHRWLNDPGVARWWEGDDLSWDGVVADYGEGNDADTEHWLATIDGEPIGWIQCCELRSQPEWFTMWSPLGAAASIIGIDYLVGEPSARGRGMGSTMIMGFVDQVVFARHPGCQQVGADPVAANTASWRALEKAGFHLLGTHDDPLGPYHLMVMNRPGRVRID